MDVRASADIHPTKTLVIDLGGSQVKILAPGQTEKRKTVSGPTMTPVAMVEGPHRQ